jgi:hypothetical protein
LPAKKLCAASSTDARALRSLEKLSGAAFGTQTHPSDDNNLALQRRYSRKV